MPITALPSPPSTNDPANFASKADVLLASLSTFVTEANATATAMNLNSTTDTSASSVLIGTGAKSFTVSTGKSFQPGMYLVIADTAAPSANSMFGQITSYDTATGALVVSVSTVKGSGTKTAWTISQSSAGGAAAGANSDITELNGLTNGIVGTAGAQTIAGVKTFTSMPVMPVQSMVRVNGSSGAGSTNTAIRRFATTVTSQGTDITFAQSAASGDSWTINVRGVYGISYTDSFSSGGDLGISLNSNQLTTSFNSITAADKLAAGQTTGANVADTCSTTIYLPAGSVIRAHFDPTNSAGTRVPLFTITRVS